MSKSSKSGAYQQHYLLSEQFQDIFQTFKFN
jgi:hypothetical protein